MISWSLLIAHTIHKIVLQFMWGLYDGIFDINYDTLFIYFVMFQIIQSENT